MPEGTYQGELFPSDAPGYRQPKPRQRALFPLRRITITIACEQLVIGVIALLMLMVVTHSLGVERGRRLALRAQRTAAPQLQPRQPSGPAAAAPAARESRADSAPRATATKPAAVSVPAATSPVKPAAPTTDVAAIPSGGGAYTIQLVTYSRPALAQRELAKLREEGQGPFLIFDGKYFFVCVGAFESMGEAARYLPTLRKRYPDAFVRKR